MRKIFTCLSLLALFALSVAAQGQTSIDYIDENGETQNTSTYTTVTANDTKWTTGTYVATGNISLSSRVTVTGSVTLILADGCNLDATQGINVGEGQSLTVYGQSEGTGNLTATGQYFDKGSNAGIGGNGTDVNFGTITLAATGTITAISVNWAAGIGGGGLVSKWTSVTGKVYIYQGTVNATGGRYAADIGVGMDCHNNTTITISGGIVTANGWSNESPNIGDGNYSGTTGIFSTGENGNAIIYAPKGISDNDDTSKWSGVIFEGNAGKVYGTSVSPRYDFTIPNGYTLSSRKAQR